MGEAEGESEPVARSAVRLRWPVSMFGPRADQKIVLNRNTVGEGFRANGHSEERPKLDERFGQAEQAFASELAASSSLNGRGTTLAGVIGATLALLANLAGHVSDFPRSVAWLYCAAVALLLVAGGSALRAVWPASSWRRELLTFQQSTAEDALWSDQIRSMLTMVEEQRLTNEMKAAWMRQAYFFFGVAGLLVAAGAVVVVIF